MIRIGVIGSGNMARKRGQAFLSTGRATICGVASRTPDGASACAAELGTTAAFAAFRELAGTRPDALLVETPHQVHDDVVPWALERGYDLLIGGNLATSVASGERFVELAERHGRVVECGYDRRYHPAWERLRALATAGELGRPVQAYAAGMFDPDPGSWYYDEAASGGMPLTHLSYVGTSYIRWIFGRPVGVMAAANRVGQPSPGRVVEENAATIVTFENGAFATVLGGYVAPSGMPEAEARFIFADGGAIPGDETLTLYRGGEPEVERYPTGPSALERQAVAFLDALERRSGQRNPPDDALWDVRIATAIRESARERRYVSL